MTGISLLLTVPLAGAADKPTAGKDIKADPVKMCYESCRGKNDKQAYDEACMLKCRETHKSQVEAPKKK